MLQRSDIRQPNNGHLFIPAFPLSPSHFSVPIIKPDCQCVSPAFVRCRFATYVARQWRNDFINNMSTCIC